MPAKPPEKNPETNADNNQSASESLDIRESQSERLSAAAETQVGTAERSSVKEADERDSVQNNLPEATEAEEVRDALQNLFDRAKQDDASGNGKGQEAAKPPGNIHGYDSHLGDISGRELNLPQFGRVLISEAKSGSGSKTEFKELDNAPKLDGRTIEAITYRPGQDTLVKFADAKEPESISTSPPEELFQFKNGDTSVIVRSDGSKVVGPTTIYHPQDAEGRLKTERKDGYSETSFKDGSYRFEFDPPGDDRLKSATVSPDGSFKAEYQREDGTFAISETATRRTETLTKGSGDFETVRTDLETGRQQLSGAEQGRRYEGDRWTGSDDQIVTQKQYEDGAVVTSFEGRPHASGADEIVFKDGKLTFIKDGKEFEPENQSDIVHSVQMRDGSQRVVRADGALDAAPASEPVAEAIAEPVVDPISEPAAVPYLTVGNELSSFSESEYDRRSVVSEDMMNELLISGRDNEEARDILEDLSSPPGFYQAGDPLLDAVKFINENMPEFGEKLEQAAITSYQTQSHDALLDVVGEAARSDPQFEQRLRYHIGQSLQSRRTEDQRTGVELLMTMSDRWTAGDMVTALEYMRPDQIMDFKTAVSNAPQDVRTAFHRSLINQDSGAVQDPGLSLFGAQPQIDFRQRIDVRDTTPRLSIDGFSGFNDMSVPPLSERAKARLAFMNQSPDSFDPFRTQSLLRSREDSTGFQFPPAGGRMGGSGLNQLLIDNLNLSRQQQQQARDTFSQAWPDERRPYSLSVGALSDSRSHEAHDTRYLSATLDSHIRDSRETISVEQLFVNNWGIDPASDNFSEKMAKAVEKYGADTLLKVDQRLQLYNALNPELRQELTGSTEPLEPSQIAGMILNEKLGKKGLQGSFLLDNPPLEQKLAQKLRESTESLRTERQELRQETGEFEEALTILEEYTKDGVGAGAMLDHGIDKLLDLLTYASVSPLPITGRSLSDLRTSGLERWEQRQEQLVEDFVTNDQEALAKVKSVADLGGRVGRMEFAEDVLAYQGLAQQEDSQERRDYMALGMLDKYGMEAIRENAPAVWKDLNNGGLTRLKEKGLVQSDQLPSFSGSSLDQQQQAFAMLRNLSRAETGNLDLPMRRKEALKIVDSDPALGKAYETMAEFSQDFAAFQRLFEAGQQGTKYEDYVDLVRENAKNLQDTLGKVTPEDIEGMRRTLDGLEQSIHEGGDPATQAALQLRRESLEAMLGILDPDSEQNQNINKLLDQAQSRDFNEDTLGNWFKENGPVIAVAAAAVAATVASMGTAAPALAVVLASSAVALAATQGTKEVLYLVNHHIGDTGLGNLNDRSYYGAWTANHWDTFGELFTSENGWAGKSEAAQELMSSYLSEVAGPMSLEYAQNVVMGLVGVGALRVGSAGFRGLSPQWVKSLVANPRSAAMLKQLANSESTAGKSFAQQWMALGRETGQEIVEEVGEEGFQTVASRALEQSGVSGPLGNMLLIATMSIGRARGQSVIARYRGGGNVDLDTSTTHNVVADLENTGHLVRNNGDGTYTVSAYNDPNSAMTIRAVEQNAAVDHDTSVESGGRPASDVEFDATPDASGDLADTSAGARRHSPDAPVGPSTEIDTRIRNLANELDAVAPGSEAATRIERQIHDSLMDQARDYARRMGLVTRNADGEITGYILDPAKIELVRGDVDSSHGQDDVIRINIDRGNPTADLFHEMKHRSEVLERTSIAMADPAAYNQRIQQDVFGELEQGGNRRLAMRDGEVTVVDRTELSTKEQKQQLAGLLRQFAAEHDTIDAASAADLESWLANNDGASYFAQQGIDQASLASLMKQEIESYRIIRDQSILPSAVVEQDLALSGFLESRGGSYARRAENGQPISNDPELHKLTRGVTEETLGIAGDPAGYHAFSPSERRAESAELARDMGLLLDQNADASIDSEKNVMRLHQVSLALNTALGKHRAQTDPASRDALWQQAQGAANDLVDMLPQSELGRDISRRLVDMGLVDNANLPPGLRVTGDGVETNGDISTGSGADTPDYDGDNRRRSTQNNPLESVRITGRTDQVVRDLASTNATVRDAATRSEIGRLMALPNPTAADVGELHRMRRSLFDSMRADQVESRELTALYDRQEAGQKLTEAESARMAELEPRFGEVNGRIRQNIEFTISMLRAEAEVARGGSSSKGGDSTEGMILHLFEKELDTPQAIFNGRTPREKGYEIVPLVKSSAMDDAGADFILVNKYSGEFMFIDPTQKSIHSPKKARLPELRKQGIISSDPRDPKYTLGNDADLGSLEYKARREDDIRRQIRGILAQAKDGSPLNIAEMFVPPSTEVARSRASMDNDERFAMIGGLPPQMQALEIRAWRAELMERKQGLTDMVDLAKEKVRKLRKDARTQDPEEAARSNKHAQLLEKWYQHTDNSTRQPGSPMYYINSTLAELDVAEQRMSGSVRPSTSVPQPGRQAGTDARPELRTRRRSSPNPLEGNLANGETNSAGGEADSLAEVPKRELSPEDLLRLRKNLYSTLVTEHGWPKEVAKKYAKALDGDQVVDSLDGLLSEDGPKTVFFGTDGPFDPSRFDSLDEVSNAATALYMHAQYQDGYVNVVDGIPPGSTYSRMGQGDNAFYEQSYGLDQQKLNDSTFVYSVPKEIFEDILTTHCKEDIVTLTDPDTGFQFQSIRPGREVVVGQKIVAELQRRKIRPVERND